MSDNGLIGPNPCPRCGGEYGEHETFCTNAGSAQPDPIAIPTERNEPMSEPTELVERLREQGWQPREIDGHLMIEVAAFRTLSRAAEEKCRTLEAEVERLKVRVDQWRTLWKQNTELASEAIEAKHKAESALAQAQGKDAEGCTPVDIEVLRKANVDFAGENQRLRQALRFYAHRQHFWLSDPNAHAWDTVSGEPPNFWCDEAGTATVEDGTVAAMALRGESIDWEDDEPLPIKGEPEYDAALATEGGPGALSVGGHGSNEQNAVATEGEKP